MRIDKIFGNLFMLMLSLFLLECSSKKSVEESKQQVVDRNTITKAEIQKTDGGFELLVNGKPFFIKGAGLEFGDMEKLAEHGGNSFRRNHSKN